MPGWLGREDIEAIIFGGGGVVRKKGEISEVWDLKGRGWYSVAMREL